MQWEQHSMVGSVQGLLALNFDAAYAASAWTLYALT